MVKIIVYLVALIRKFKEWAARFECMECLEYLECLECLEYLECLELVPINREAGAQTYP